MKLISYEILAQENCHDAIVSLSRPLMIFWKTAENNKIVRDVKFFINTVNSGYEIVVRFKPDLNYDIDKFANIIHGLSRCSIRPETWFAEQIIKGSTAKYEGRSLSYLNFYEPFDLEVSSCESSALERFVNNNIATIKEAIKLIS